MSDMGANAGIAATALPAATASVYHRHYLRAAWIAMCRIEQGQMHVWNCRRNRRT